MLLSDESFRLSVIIDIGALLVGMRIVCLLLNLTSMSRVGILSCSNLGGQFIVASF